MHALLTVWLLLAANTGSDPGTPLAAVRDRSYPQLKNAAIRVKPLHSDSVYFEARFTFSSFLFRRRLHYLMGANQLAVDRGAPAEAVTAILAHELAHVNYYDSGSRLRLLGLVRLLSPAFNVRFERKADLDAIALGYGPGLILYRNWLYAHIPPRRVAAKKRNYFTPNEIDAIVKAVRRNPESMKRFLRNVPRNLEQIRALSR